LTGQNSKQVVLIAFLLISTGCSLKPTGVAPLVPTPTALQVQSSPQTLTELYRTRLTAGDWTAGQGLVNLLGFYTGSATEQEAIGNHAISEFELTGLVRLADQYLAANPNGDLHDEIQKQVDLLVAPIAELQRFSRPGNISGGALHPANLSMPSKTEVPIGDQAQCQSIWTEGFHSTIPVICFEYGERNVSGTDIWLYYPSWWTEDEPKRAYLASILEGAATAVGDYNAYGPNPLPPVTMVVTELPGFRPGTSIRDNNLMAVARSFEFPSSDCYVGLFPFLFTVTPIQSEQAVAHEMFHCYEYKNLPGQVSGPESSASDWWVEGAAEYFSNVVYPAVNLEYQWLSQLPILMRDHRSLFTWSYKSFIFFQYLENRPELGMNGVLQLLRSMATTGNQADQTTALAAFPNMERIFHDFALAVADQSIMDTNGSSIRFEVPSQVDTSFGSEATPGSSFYAPRFVVEIWPITFNQGLDFTLTLTVNTGSGLNDTRLVSTPGVWSALPGTLSTSCLEGNYYLVITQTSVPEPDQYEILLRTDSRPAANVCDTCLLGNWRMDLPSYLTHLNALISRAAPNLVYTDIDGAVLVDFTPEMSVTQTIDNLSVSAQADVAGVGTQQFSFVMDGSSDATYTLAQNRITYLSFSDDINVTTMLNGQEMAAQTEADYMSTGPMGSGATYICSGNTLNLTPRYENPDYNDLPALLFNREP
jgi:hypothetical protein